MKNANLQWKIYLFWVALAEGIGLLAGFLTRENTELYSQMMIKPALSPPGWIFPVVWTVLFALMGIGAATISLQPDSRKRSRALNIFVAQLIVNFFWSLIFFNAQAYGFALAWLLLLWVLILWMILAFWQADKGAALLQIPYILWVTFAAYLNYGVWKLN